MTYTMPSNYTDMPSLLAAVNDMVNGFYGMSLLLMIFLVSFLALKQYSTEQSFTVACFITLFSTIFLAIMQIVDVNLIILPCIALAYSLFFLNK